MLEGVDVTLLDRMQSVKNNTRMTLKDEMSFKGDSSDDSIREFASG